MAQQVTKHQPTTAAARQRLVMYMNRTMVLAAAAGTAVVTAAAFYFRRRKAARIANKSVLELLPFERSTLLAEENSVSTITFFSGSHASAAEYLATRVAEILKFNPWCGGWLENGKCYYDSTADVGVFRACAAGEIPLSRGTSMRKMGAAVATLLCKKGQPGFGVPIFRVTLVPDSDDPAMRFALVVSMSHVIGDGHTFYMLHNMLSANDNVVALDAQRRPGVSDAIDAAMGDGKHAIFNPGFVMNCIGGLLYSALLRTTVEVRTFHVDETYIAAQKSAAKASGASAFVSTNDVITSWFLQRGGFGLGMMAVNFRGRLPDAPMSLAGNYESVVLYRLADVATPSLLRRSLAKFRRAATPSTDLPSSREHLVRAHTQRATRPISPQPPAPRSSCAADGTDAAAAHT